MKRKRRTRNRRLDDKGRVWKAWPLVVFRGASLPWWRVSARSEQRREQHNEKTASDRSSALFIFVVVHLSATNDDQRRSVRSGWWAADVMTNITTNASIEQRLHQRHHCGWMGDRSNGRSPPIRVTTSPPKSGPHWQLDLLWRGLVCRWSDSRLVLRFYRNAHTVIDVV